MTSKNPKTNDKSIMEFLKILLLHVCKKYLFIETHVKIGLYLAITLILSIVKDILPPIDTYMSAKHNLLNVVFVKWGWLWTLITLVPFVILTSYTYTCGTFNLVLKHVMRILVVGTSVWFVCVRLFVHIEHLTGECWGKTSYKDKVSCKKFGHSWLGFDISGHCFLLVYCNLLISEEIRTFKNWENIGEMLSKNFKEGSDNVFSPLRKLSVNQIEALQSSYEKQTPRIKVFLILLTLLSILWEVMLIFTCLFFHSLLQKILGTLIAILCWYATYKMWFKSGYSPGLPGDGMVKYWNLKRKN